MLNTIILAEYRRGGKAAIIERLDGDLGYEYRVTVSERFRALSKAEEAFLSVAPPGARERLARQITGSNKSSLMR